jgi:ppGpp synthetase/RelA/SpoT-type nucleotidyltranferase
LGRTDDLQREWLADQVARYGALRPRYREYAKTLEAILRATAERLAPLAVVQSRAKALASFAEKALRKRAKHADPVGAFTDLCGARVITRTHSEALRVLRHLETHFDIDWDNSLDASERLRPAEFGYRSVHYVVSLRAGWDYGVLVNPELQGLKAEVQVRTFAEHVWADFAHELGYKGAFRPPESWERELAGLAASLEEIDRAFGRFEERLRPYASTYGSYLSQAERREELDRLVLVHEHDPGADLAARAAKLAITLEDWERAIALLSQYVRTDDLEATPQAVLRDLGVALCKLHARQREGAEFLRGQHYLEIASDPARGDADAIASFAGTWKRFDDKRARELYRIACQVDPGHPYPVGNLLEYELADNPEFLDLAALLVREPIQRRRAQAAVGVDLPWAWYDLGKFQLLRGEVDASLRAYAKAIDTSSASFMIETSLASVERLSAVAARLPGHECARRLLVLGAAARFPSPEARARVVSLATPGRPDVTPPVVMLAGGTDRRVEAQMQNYAEPLRCAFAAFEGILVCGGTREGVSGLAGDVAAVSAGRIRALGYLPAQVPEDATPDTDERRYARLVRTSGASFSALEPLQSWIDLAAAGISPRDVRVIGINGGAIAALEFRVALALGATVGVIAGSGREADRILADPLWSSSASLVPLPSDRYTLRAFVGWRALELPPEFLERIAEAVHEAYRRERRGTLPANDPALEPWSRLREDLRRSNLAQAAHIAEKLREVGAAIAAADAPGEPLRLEDSHFEQMSEMEHGRWNVERLLDGWRWGEGRDPERRTSPHLVAWVDLPDEIREYDRAAARRIPGLLAAMGLSIRRSQPGNV